MGGYSLQFYRTLPWKERLVRFGFRATRAAKVRAIRWAGPDAGRWLRSVSWLSRRGAPDGPDVSISGDPWDSPVDPSPNGQDLVVSVIGSLASGGSERQLVTFLTESTRRGLARHELLTTEACRGLHAHYLPALAARGIAVHQSGSRFNEDAFTRLRSNPRMRQQIMSLPEALRDPVIDLMGEFLHARPRIVHAWLDHTNIVAGLAALAVGVPQVILSLRSLNPSNFPGMHQPWMRPWYRKVAENPRVAFIANSRRGAASYADWLCVDPGRVAVIPNGIDPGWIQRPSETEVVRVRALLGASGSAGSRPRIVGGIFRISEEKQPFLWLDVVSRVLQERDDIVFFHAGEGNLESNFRSASARLVATGRLHLLGRRSDVPALLAASDALLHTARVEGTPNVILEAACLGCPVVATRAGGTPDTVEEGGTGLLRGIDDRQGLAEALLSLLEDEPMRARLAARGPALVGERFALERMVLDTHAVYRPSTSVEATP